MAIVSNPLSSERASGKVGPLVHFSHRGQQAVRSLVSPTNPRTSVQQLSRAYLATNSTAWGALTAAQRTGWTSYGTFHPASNALGKKITLTGNNWYVGLNSLVLKAGGSASADPPTVGVAASLLSLTQETGDITPAETGMSWDVVMNGTPSASDFFNVRIAGPFTTAARKAQTSDFRHHSFLAGNVTEVFAYGLIEDGNYWAEIYYFDQFGQKTIALRDQFVAFLGV